MRRKTAGFTLIEVVLVLAIAGLIITIVFTGVAGAKRSREDSQRRNDLSRIAAMMESYAGNNLGKYPTTAEVNSSSSVFRTKYGSRDTKDPVSGQYYVFEPDFDPCVQGNAYNDHGPGYISYVSPGNGSNPFTLRICLTAGEFYVNK